MKSQSLRLIYFPITKRLLHNINWLCLISKRRTFCESALAKEEKMDNHRLQEALLIKANTEYGCHRCAATHLVREPVVAGFKMCSSKYCRTSRTLSSNDGKANSTISSNRSLIAQSNWSGWLLARTNMNL